MNALDIKFLEPVKNRKGLKVYSREGTMAFKLYDTMIMTKNFKFIMLNSGGFKTKHTKNCMNDNLPEGYRVFQKDFEWYVDTPKGIVDFSDEMVLEITSG